MQRVTEHPSVNSLYSHAKKSGLSSHHELLKLHSCYQKDSLPWEKKIQSVTDFSSAEQ